jgi:hypothetical protein
MRFSRLTIRTAWKNSQPVDGEAPMNPLRASRAVSFGRADFTNAFIFLDYLASFWYFLLRSLASKALAAPDRDAAAYYYSLSDDLPPSSLARPAGLTARDARRGHPR